MARIFLERRAGHSHGLNPNCDTILSTNGFRIGIMKFSSQCKCLEPFSSNDIQIKYISGALRWISTANSFYPGRKCESMPSAPGSNRRFL